MLTAAYGSGQGCNTRAHWVHVWKRTNSPSAALRAGLPASAWAERRLLMGLEAAMRKKKDWASACRDAFLSLPKTIRFLYVHAYLDRLWNLVVSDRVRRGGARRVVAGDVVALESEPLAQDEDGVELAGMEDDEAPASEEGDDAGVLEDGGSGGVGTGAYPLWNGRDGAGVVGKVAVHVVTEDEAEADAFSIQDVVVPRAGCGLSAEVRTVSAATH